MQYHTPETSDGSMSLGHAEQPAPMHKLLLSYSSCNVAVALP